MALDGWCPEEKARWTYDLVKSMPGPCSVVEDGVFGGRWLIAAAMALRERDSGYALGVDPYSRAAGMEGWELESEHSVWWSTVDLAAVRDRALKAIEELELQRWCGVVQSPIECVAESLHFDQSVIHLDGNHSEQAALRDVRLLVPKLGYGGFLIFDDVHWPSVQPARRELKQRLKLVYSADTWEAYQRN